MPNATLQRNIFQRIFGICASRQPSDDDCWTFQDGRIIVDLARAPELAEANGAIRLEKKNLPERVLLIRGDDGQYRAFRNSCTHGRRRLDPVPAAGQVQCCSMGKSTFDHDGKQISGPATEDLTTYTTAITDGKLLITL